MGTAYALGPFRLDTQSDVLWRGTEPAALGRRAIALLRALVERRGTVVSKDTLIDAAWSGQVVEENNLTVLGGLCAVGLGPFARGSGRSIHRMADQGACRKFPGLVRALCACRCAWAQR